MLLARHYDITLDVTRTGQQIPFPYVIDASDGSDLGGVTPLEQERHFPTTEFAAIGDELPEGLFGQEPATPQRPEWIAARSTDFRPTHLHRSNSTAHTTHTT